MEPRPETHKQVIVMRADLNMRKGKMIAQGAHASMKVFLDAATRIPVKCYPVDGPPNVEEWLAIPLTAATGPWLLGLFTKIVVRVESEEELLEVHARAKAAGLLTALVEDQGKTEFHGQKTHTCIAVGPDENAKVDAVTGGLKLL